MGVSTSPVREPVKSVSAFDLILIGRAFLLCFSVREGGSHLDCSRDLFHFQGPEFVDRSRQPRIDAHNYEIITLFLTAGALISTALGPGRRR